VQALNVYAGADIPLEITAGLAFAIGKVVEYFVPQPAKELISKIDNEIVAAAGHSSESAVSPAVGAAATQAVVEEALAPSSPDFDALLARISGKAP
jgi:hypothetical protein